MKRNFIVTGWALVSALGIVAISGCGSSDSSTTVASNSSPSATAPAPTPSGPASSGPMGPPAESGSSAGPASGPPAGYGPPGGAPGSSEGSSGGAGSSGMQMQFDNGSGEGMVNSGGGSSGGFTGEMAGASSGIGMPEGYGEGMVNSGGGSSAGTATPGGPYGGGPKGVGGTAPNSGGGINPGQMAQYGNSGGQQMSSGASAPSLPSLDGSSGGGIGAPMGAPNGFGGIGGAGGPGQAAPPPTGPQKPEEDAPFLEKAKYAFAFGREPDAYKFALAHALSGAEDANVVLDEIQWVKDLMSPNSGISFAVGMDLKAPPGISDYKPVGSVDPNAAGGAAGGGSGRLGLPDPGMMGGSGIVGGPGIGGVGGGGVGRKDDPETFSKATGEMGRAFVRMFEERFLEGKFGKLFLEVENAAGSMSAAPSGGAPGFPGGSAGIGPSSGFDGGMEGGLVSPGGRMGAPGMGPGAGAPGAAKKSLSTGHRLTPGLAYIGTGNMGELKTKASKDGFDCLVFFDVQVEQNKRNGRVNNDTRVQIVSLKTGKIIASSKKLNNYEVQKRIEDGDGDGIDAALQVVFSKLDEQLILSPLPTLKPDVVQKRISDLINSKQVSTLKALGEVCLFHHLKLINDEERTSAYELLLEGADGNILGTGSVEDKRAVLDKLMPKL